MADKESRGVLRCPYGPRFNDCALEGNPCPLKDTEVDFENRFSVHSAYGTMESNSCPAKDKIDNALATCPFLGRVRQVHGEQYTRRLAVNPFIAAREENSGKHAPLFPEDEGKSFDLAFQLFHGPTLGTIPLASKKTGAANSTVSLRFDKITENRGVAVVKEQRATTIDWQNKVATAESKEACARCPLQSGEAEVLPPLMASISLSGFHFLPDPKSFMLQLRGQKNNKQQQKRSGLGGSSGKPGGGDASKPGKGGPSRNGISISNGHGPVGGAGTVKGRGVGSMTSSPSVGGHGSLKPPTNQRNTGKRGGPESDSFWKKNPIGGLLPLAGAKSLQCPAAIVSMRAAVARMKAVRRLRPQALPIRSLALASVAISFNIPCGMLREHTKKFSPQWILAVHATIPFVAMLRKAVMMPAWGLGLTVLGSIAGQQMGSVLEKRRLEGTLRPPTKHLYNNSLSRGIKLQDMPRQAILMLLPDNHPLAVQ
eukprot:jgi/Picsp_1/4935/NSC_02299-R1_protein